MRNIRAVFTKQFFSYVRNPDRYGTVLVFLAIPFAVLMLVPGAGEDREIIVAQFVTMFVGISTLFAAAGFIAEDRNTMNLRFMGMAGVKPFQYLIGTCGVLLLVSLAANLLFAMQSMYTGVALMNFMLVTMLGAACSVFLGITLSLSKKIAPFAPVCGLVLGIGPMFSDVNEFLSTMFSFTFTQQVTNVIRAEDVDIAGDITFPLQVILVNMAVMLVLFVVLNARNGLDGEKAIRA